MPSRLARILDAELASLARWAESVGGRFGACFLDAERVASSGFDGTARVFGIDDRGTRRVFGLHETLGIETPERM